MNFLMAAIGHHRDAQNPDVYEYMYTSHELAVLHLMSWLERLESQGRMD
jgi:hypothetical protein